MKALRGQMPRTLLDHRTAFAKRLRAVYEEIGARFPLADGVSRRVAVLTARAWLEYEAVSREVVVLGERSARGTERGKAAAALARSRRRQAACAAQYLSGLQRLEQLTAGDGHGQPFDLARELARLQAGRPEVHRGAEKAGGRGGP